MRQDILEIARELELKHITTKQAKEHLLALFGVSHRRELLIDFAIRFDGGNTRTNRKAYKQEVDDYLKSINCG